MVAASREDVCACRDEEIEAATISPFAYERRAIFCILAEQCRVSRKFQWGIKKVKRKYGEYGE